MRTGAGFAHVAALTATALGIARAHVNMPCEVLTIRAQFARHLELSGDQQPLLLVRFGYAEPFVRAPRRPLHDVLRARK